MRRRRSRRKRAAQVRFRRTSSPPLVSGCPSPRAMFVSSALSLRAAISISVTGAKGSESVRVCRCARCDRTTRTTECRGAMSIEAVQWPGQESAHGPHPRSSSHTRTPRLPILHVMERNLRSCPASKNLSKRVRAQSCLRQHHTLPIGEHRTTVTRTFEAENPHLTSTVSGIHGETQGGTPARANVPAPLVTLHRMSCGLDCV